MQERNTLTIQKKNLTILNKFLLLYIQELKHFIVGIREEMDCNYKIKFMMWYLHGRTNIEDLKNISYKI
jgi:hypothetical protein